MNDSSYFKTDPSYEESKAAAEKPEDASQERSTSATLSSGLWDKPFVENITDEETRRSEDLANQLGHYRIVSVLGKGGFGTVYKATDTNLGRDVAIKFLTRPLEHRELQLFKREARVIAMLSKHPSVIQIFDWGESEGCPYFVLEYVEKSAASILSASSGGIEVTEALRIVLECAEALTYAHGKGILHRDIKPANILIESENNRAKLADFGLARILNSNEATVADAISGSPPYMSPEQAEGKALDARSDVYSLGVTLYKLLSGAIPCDGNSAMEVMFKVRNNEGVPLKKRKSGLPGSVLDLVDKATEHRPDGRYQTANEFAEAIREVLTPLMGGVEPPRTIVPKPLWQKVVTGFAAAAAALALLFAGSYLMPGSEGGAGANISYAAAKQAMDSGDLVEAETIFSQIPETDPEYPKAVYGLGFAYLKQERDGEAETVFAGLKDDPLGLEGAAALAYAKKGAGAREDVERAKASAKESKYPDVLLAKIDAIDEKYDAIIERLSSLQPENMAFLWQYAEAQKLLGQAYYSLARFSDAVSTFEGMKQSGGADEVPLIDQYLEAARNSGKEARKQEISERIKRLGELAREAKQEAVTRDKWTSRKLSFFVLPPQVNKSQYAVESGLADFLPMLLSDALDETNMTPVDRELLADALAEQELAANVGSTDNPLILGEVLGSRFIIQPKFMALGAKQSLTVTMTDVESTNSIGVQRVPIEAGADPEEVAGQLARSIFASVQEEYPIQGRLYQLEGVARLNIGASAGVEPGMAFEVFADPDTTPLPGVVATVETAVGAAEAPVQLTGVDVQELPDSQEAAWYARVKQ